ncbi:MAG TPA: ABC transporter permease [Bryobacteraceae bacterium]|nr:ABC transporter permease [Bryobacteraceae bacterium]
MLFQLVRRDFEQRYVGSAMGWIWGLIQPLVLLLSWTLVFGFFLKQQAPPGVHSYALFLFAGMLPWMLFSETLQRSASSIVEQGNLITKTVFPAEIVPVSIFFSSLVGHALALVLMAVAACIWQGPPSVFLLLLPVYAFAIGLMAVGLGWIAASLHVFLRDTAQVLSVALTFWFWVTPIFLSEKYYLANPWTSALLAANPLAYAVRGYRAMLLGYPATPSAADLGIALGSGAAVFVIGGLFFRHMKRGFADVL